MTTALRSCSGALCSAGQSTSKDNELAQFTKKVSITPANKTIQMDNSPSRKMDFSKGPKVSGPDGMQRSFFMNSGEVLAFEFAKLLFSTLTILCCYFSRMMSDDWHFSKHSKQLTRKFHLRVPEIQAFQ